MKKKAAFFCLAFFALTVNAFCDTLILKSGKQIEGTIKEKTNDSVKISAYGVDLTYYIDEIDRIVEGPVSVVSAPAPAAREVPVEAVAEVMSQPERVGSEPVTQSLPIVSSEEPPPQVSAGAQHLAQILQDKSAKDKALRLAGVFLIVAVILILIFYVYSSICLQMIAQKTFQEPSWLAWVPIGNLILMCKIASVPYWWLLGFLLGAIPVIGIIINIGLAGYIWYRIALARNKPGWVGILSLVPVVNLVIMGYLAFSE